MLLDTILDDFFNLLLLVIWLVMVFYGYLVNLLSIYVLIYFFIYVLIYIFFNVFGCVCICLFWCDYWVEWYDDKGESGCRVGLKVKYYLKMEESILREWCFMNCLGMLALMWWRWLSALTVCSASSMLL